MKRYVRRQVLRAVYRADLRRPLDPDLAVYGAYWNRGVACNPAAIHAKARELVPHVRGLWVVSSRHRDRMPPGVPYVIEGSRPYWRAMATATYLVNNSSFTGGFTKRPGQRYLQTHHGTPLKTMGLDQRAYPALARTTDFDKILAHVGQWDASLSSNPHSTEVWDHVYPGGYERLDLGYPRNDVYFTATAEEIARVRAGLGIAEGQTALLYAPHPPRLPRRLRPRPRPATPRGRTRPGVRGPGARPLLLRTVRRARRHRVGARPRRHRAPPDRRTLPGGGRVDHRLLLPHLRLRLPRPPDRRPRPRLGRLPGRPRYLLRPALRLRPGDTPGPVTTTPAALADVFRTGEWRSPEAAALRTAFRARFCPYDDGRAAERVVRRFFAAPA